MLQWQNATNEDVLATWDRGESVWSCSMGGFGPGYEQALQMIGFEMLRGMVATPPESWPPPKDPSTDDLQKWYDYTNAIEALPAVKAMIDKLNPSGAMVMAALNLASVFARQGYSNGMDMVPDDRKIQVKKDFP